jgi:hypothetical protein
MGEPLLTPETWRELRTRPDPEELAERQRWPRTIVWSLFAGAVNALGGLLYGLSGTDALIIGAAISVTVFVVIVVAGWVMKRPVVPGMQGD